MAKRVFNMQGGLHSAAAYSGFENRAWGSCVANAASFVATPGSGMNLNISTGDGLISVDAFLARRIQTTTTELAAVPAASASFARIDTLVAYIDTTVTPTTAVIDNVNDILKFAVVAGTAAATPAAPSAAAIQSSIGAGNPYMALYDVTVPQSATNVSGVTLTDRRKVVTAIDATQIADNTLPAAKLVNASVPQTKLNFTPNVTLAYKELKVTKSVGSVNFRADMPDYNVAATITSGMRIRVKFVLPQVYTSADGVRHDFSIVDDQGRVIQTLYKRLWNSANGGDPLTVEGTDATPTAGARTYRLCVFAANATITVYANATAPTNQANTATGICTVETF